MTEVMDAIHFSPYFKAFLQILGAEGVEYLVVGGYAVHYHGYSRSRRDLDVWTGTRRDNAEKIAHVMHAWTGESLKLPTEIFEHPNRIIRFRIPLVNIEIVDPIIGQTPRVLEQFQAEVDGHIEILTVQTGVDFYDCFPNREVVQVEGVMVNMISLPDLKKIKLAGDRPKDRQDLAHLP